MRNVLILCLLGLLLGACADLKINVVPTTSNTAADSVSAQNNMPNLSNYGYTSTDARSITDAIAAVGGSGALLTGNPIAAAGIAKIDDMIRCYSSVGAVAARIYTQVDLGQLVQGQIPKVGALAVINRERVANNFLPCALNQGQGFSAQSATIEPCAGTGSMVRNGATFDYIYAGTDEQLCSLFAASMQ